MHILDFHAKLASNEGEPLFEALRSLSLFEDPKAMFNADGGVVTMGEWITWPPMDAHASDSSPF
jgi:hypothetical protein